MEISEKRKKGDHHYENKEFLLAVECYTEVIKVNDEDADVFHDRALALFHLGRGEEALEDLNKARDLQPDKGYRYSSRAFMRDHLGDLDGAIADYKVAIEIDPEDAISHNNLGLLEEKKGYKVSSNKRFTRADQLTEEDKERYKRGEALKDKKEEIARQEEAKKEKQTKRIPVEGEEENGKKPTIGRIFKEMFSVITSKEDLRGFFRFIKRGFK